MMSPKDLGSLAFKLAGVIVIAQALLLLPDLLSIPGFPQYTDDEFGLNAPLIAMGYVVPIVLLLGLGFFLISSSRRLAQTTILDGVVETRLNAVTVHATLLSVIGVFLVGYAAGDVPSVIRDFSIAQYVEEVDPYQSSRRLAREDAVKVEGVVLDPAGTPVRAAQVIATTKCGLLVLDRVGTAETDDQGKFVLKIVPEHCGSVMLSAWKNDDFWLESGQQEDVLENPGTAPEIDLLGTRPDQIVIHLGSRGGKLSIETTDKDNSFWPSVVFINHCGSNGSALSTGWSFISVESPTSERLLPEGSYCVGIQSANGMYPMTPTCTVVEVVVDQRQEVTLMIDPLTLTTEAVPQERGCPSQIESEDSAPARPVGDAKR